MAGLKGITINTPPEAEPHIYAEDDAAIYKAIFGGDGVSTIGQACKATVLSNNKVRIADGVLCVDGHMARIPYGEYEDCEIMNGQSEKNRNDIIVAKFETTGTGGIDTMTCEVIQGTAGETATDPELTQDDIYTGGKTRELPLYRVKIEGLSIVAVEQMFELKPTTEELKKMIDGLNKDLSNKIANMPQIKAGTIIKTVAGGNNSVDVFTNAEINKMFGVSDATNLNTVAIFTEGDAAARTSGGHMDGTAYLNETWYATYAELFSGTAKVRINYTIIYFG